MDYPPSPVEVHPDYAAHVAGNVAPATYPPVVSVDATAERSCPPPKSSSSIHRYGYRSPRFGVSEDGDSSCGGRGGGGWDGCSPERLRSSATAGGAAVAREVMGWTRPVPEGGSMRLAAGEAVPFSILPFLNTEYFFSHV